MHAGPRVAVLSVHTSPIDQPGSGDSGGMNVYIRAVAERLAARGINLPSGTALDRFQVERAAAALSDALEA